MNIIKSVLTLLALGLAVPSHADQHAAETSPKFSNTGRNQLKRFDNAVTSGAGRMHIDVPVISVQRFFNRKNWVQQIRWDEQSGFINEFAFPLPLATANDFKPVIGADHTSSGWVQVESEGNRYEYSVREIDKIYFRVQRRLLMPQFDIRTNILNPRQLDFFKSDRLVYEFHLPESIQGEIVGFSLNGKRLSVETSSLRRNEFLLRDEDDGEFELAHVRYGQKVLDLVELRADRNAYAPCGSQLKP